MDAYIYIDMYNDAYIYIYIFMYVPETALLGCRLLHSLLAKAPGEEPEPPRQGGSWERELQPGYSWVPESERGLYLIHHFGSIFRAPEFLGTSKFVVSTSWGSYKGFIGLL